jgi:hypothetical protein
MIDDPRPYGITLVAILALALPFTPADEPKDGPKEPPKTEVKDYTEFSKLLHKMVTADAPREKENRSQWGKTIPIPPRLRLPNAKRTIVRVGDHDEVPNGPWRRLKVWMDDPVKDVVIRVRDFDKVDNKSFRLVLDAYAPVHAEGEAQRWVNGILLARVQAQADAAFALSMNVDVPVKLNTNVFPPEVIIEPKVAECKVVVKEFLIRKIGDVQIEGDIVKDALGIDLREYVQQLATTYEPQVKERINDAIAKTLRDGKGPNVLELLKVIK